MTKRNKPGIDGEKDLTLLFKSVKFYLDSREFVFAKVSLSERKKIKVTPICQFHEKEGITLILEKYEAENNKLKFIYPCKMIVLNVHSNLNAVGFIAAITNKLAEHKISVNPVSAYYHDYLFVPHKKARQSLKILLQNFGEVV